MKLTGKLKENVAKAGSKEQAKEMIAKAGMELTDDEMDMVSGGLASDVFVERETDPTKESTPQDEYVQTLRQQRTDITGAHFKKMFM